MENLRLRFEDGEVYTTCGRIVVSVNPFRWLDLYGEERAKRYHAAEDPFATEAPHVYSITHAALNEIAVQASRGLAMRTCGGVDPGTYRLTPHLRIRLCRPGPTLGHIAAFCAPPELTPAVLARRLPIHPRVGRVGRRQDGGDEDLHALPRRRRRALLRRRLRCSGGY